AAGGCRGSEHRRVLHFSLRAWDTGAPWRNAPGLWSTAGSITTRGASVTGGRCLTLGEFGEIYLGGKNSQTAKRRVLEDRIPHIVDHGQILIKESDAVAWRDARLETPASPDLKSLLKEIARKTLAERNRAKPRG